MNNKKTKVLIICIIILVVVIIGIAGTLYFLLGMKKSNKEILVAELSQFMNQGENQTNELEQYFTKKQTTQNTNQGKFTAKMSSGLTDLQGLPVIIFSGKSNPESNQVEQNIEIQYTDNVKFPINYKQDGDIFGLQTDYVSQKYVAVENNNLPDLVKKFGIEDTTQIPNKLELPEEENPVEMTDEEKRQLKETYQPIFDTITDDKIVIEETENGKKYTVTLSTQDVKDMLMKFLDILQNDTTIIGKINQIFESTNNDADITEYIENLKENLETVEASAENTFSVIITTENDESMKFQMNNDNTTVILQKIKTANNLEYMLNVNSTEENNPSEIMLSAKFTGLGTQENVEEDYTVQISAEGNSLQYHFQNEVSFEQPEEFEKLTDETAMILNNMEDEKVQTLMNAIGERIVLVNKDQMAELGLGENENPLMAMFPFLNFGSMIFDSANSVIEDAETNTVQ